MANNPRLSAEQLGKRVASMFLGQKKILRVPWEDPGGVGPTGLFDRTLGGDRVGAGPCSALKGLPYVRSTGQAVLDPALGRYGYRTVSGYDLWRVDFTHSMFHGREGPWLLMPRSPAVVRKMELLMDQPGMRRTIPRQKNPDAWRMYTPEKVLGGGSRSTTFSVVFNINRVINIARMLTLEEVEEAMKTIQISRTSSPAGGGGSWFGSSPAIRASAASGNSSPQSTPQCRSLFNRPKGDMSPLVSTIRSSAQHPSSRPLSPLARTPARLRRASMGGSVKGMVPKHDPGEQAVMSLIEFNKEWGRLRDDVFFDHLNHESKLVEAFVMERTKRQAEAAERARMIKQAELDVVDRLRRRAEVELLEANEANERADKEREEFYRAKAVFEAEKEGLKKMIVLAEQDGTVDQEEQDAINKLQIEVRIAHARLEKEKSEYFEWEQKAQKEVKCSPLSLMLDDDSLSLIDLPL